jgi:hypothetical protein
VLVLYDARRLFAVFVTNEGAPPAAQPTIFEGRMPDPLRWAIKFALVASVAASSVAAFQSGELTPAKSVTSASGAWGIMSFTRDAGPAGVPEAPRWRRLIVDDGSIAVRLDNDAMMRCRRTPAVDPSTIAFTCGRDRKGELRWTLTDAHLQLDGTFEGLKMAMSARRLDEKDYPLIRGGFHVIYDR